MLSFFQDACDQIGEESLNKACDWAVANPMAAMVALGLGIAGGLFWSRSHHAAQSSQLPVVARMVQPARQRDSVLTTIEGTAVDMQGLPSLPKQEMAAPEKMPVQMIVNAYLEQQAAMRGNISRMRLIPILFPAQGPIAKTLTPAEINTKVFANLGLPADAQIPANSEGRSHYNQVLRDLKLDHLMLAESQLKRRY